MSVTRVGRFKHDTTTNCIMRDRLHHKRHLNSMCGRLQEPWLQSDQTLGSVNAGPTAF